MTRDDTWSVVGPDGRPVEVRSYGEPDAALGAPALDPHSVADVELFGRAIRQWVAEATA
ncbi:hypothetical protein OH799_23620 [Nocardia sp. NBC_00881]|uniref:hypothetical protein n=1 Tax=Nocardia sp. NBC_00881 TaxID=2975995 RepID=UPI00386ED6A0|nr:hypothetical protein OH799_23620 [Nocardia sp. NBC_00881]